YEVYGNCTFDLDEVERQADDGTIALFYVHYFGFPNQLEEMCALARRLNVLMIEDCALSIGGTHKGKPLGTFGDVALFSLRKMFLFTEGGFLRLSETLSEFQPQYEWRVNNCYSIGRYAKQRIKYAYVRLTGGADPLRVFKVDPVGYVDTNAPAVLNVKMLSSFSEHRLKYVDMDRVVRKRRENYTTVAQRFPASKVFRPLHFSLPEGCIPYSFPMLVDNDHRDFYRHELLRRGIVTGAGWPESPFHPSQKPCRALSDRLLELPVHHALTRRQLLRSLEGIKQLEAARP
ncbi:MAG: DegT/DnrJ/EryC1/StrS family aminotransferase, partial [Bacteroidota bacterium]